MSIAKLGKKLSQEHCRRISEGLNELGRQRKFERRSKALKEFYRTNTVWNKGLSWSLEIREKIRQGCLNSSIGMGPKAGPVQGEEMEVIV